MVSAPAMEHFGSSDGGGGEGSLSHPVVVKISMEVDLLLSRVLSIKDWKSTSPSSCRAWPRSQRLNKFEDLSQFMLFTVPGLKELLIRLA